MAICMFRYDACGNVFETKPSMGDDLSIITCPTGYKKTQRLFTPPAVMFKGKGFYTTDNQPMDNKQGQSGKVNIKSAIYSG